MKEMIEAICMVYNEIDFIEMWMKNVDGLVDNILIMDGGSTDGTLEAITKVSQEIETMVDLVVDKQEGEDYNDPKYNHAERRNKLIGYSKGDWIFQMDVDESIDDSDENILRNLIKSNKMIYTFLRYDFCWDPKYFRLRTYNRVPWLYKGHIGIRYGKENPPHELLEYNGIKLGEYSDRQDTNIMIYHWHYCWGRKAVRDYFVDPPTWKEFLKKSKKAVEEEGDLIKWEGELPDIYYQHIHGKIPKSYEKDFKL